MVLLRYCRYIPAQRDRARDILCDSSDTKLLTISVLSCIVTPRLLGQSLGLSLSLIMCRPIFVLSMPFEETCRNKNSVTQTNDPNTMIMPNILQLFLEKFQPYKRDLRLVLFLPHVVRPLSLHDLVPASTRLGMRWWEVLDHKHLLDMDTRASW